MSGTHLPEAPVVLMDRAFAALEKPNETEQALDCLSDHYTWLEGFASRLIDAGHLAEADEAIGQLSKVNRALYIVGK